MFRADLSLSSAAVTLTSYFKSHFGGFFKNLKIRIDNTLD